MSFTEHDSAKNRQSCGLKFWGSDPELGTGTPGSPAYLAVPRGPRDGGNRIRNSQTRKVPSFLRQSLGVGLPSGTFAPECTIGDFTMYGERKSCSPLAHKSDVSHVKLLEGTQT
eukprot:3658504-Pyramimonas_sp.AAC.1